MIQFKFKYLKYDKNMHTWSLKCSKTNQKLGSVALVETEGVAPAMGVVCEKAGQELAHLLGDMMY